MSTAYHPETDGSSERINKTTNQTLRYFVDHHQNGWIKALLRVRLNLMTSVNASTGLSHLAMCSPLLSYRTVLAVSQHDLILYFYYTLVYLLHPAI
jgi:hypothetical protein